MKLTSRILLTLFSLLTIISFQNCGQSGEISMQGPSGESKLNGNQPVSGSDLIVDPDHVDQNNDVSHGSIRNGDRPNEPVDVSKSEPNYDVDENDGTIHSGPMISCAGLNKLMMMANKEIKSSSGTDVDNFRGPLKISDRDQLSVNNHRGILFLLNINTILSLNNIRSMLLYAEAHSINSINNVRALSMINSENIDSINNFRGLLCLDSVTIKDISNFRGILEISGNVETISNFRGLLKVKGNIQKLENFRGKLEVDGNIVSQVNVQVKL